MDEQQKTHYRKAFNSPYLSSADIIKPTVLTIRCVELRKDETKKTQDQFNTAFFKEKELRKGEPLKPMILNAHNSRVMRDMTSSHFIDDWQNVPVTVYVDHNVRFGRDTVEGLRISAQLADVNKKALSDDEFNTKFESWKNRVISGTNKPMAIISHISNSFDLTEDQINSLMTLKSLSAPELSDVK
jgi:hypothetical protein